MAKSDLIESEKNLESLSANFLFFFGISPVDPKIDLSILEIKDDIEKMKILSLKENPKINDLIFKIKSLEYKISTLKRKKIT